MAVIPEKNIIIPAVRGDHQKINFFLVISIGLVVLLSSVFVFLFILRESFGNFPPGYLLPMRNFEKLLGKSAEIALLYPDTNRINMPAGSSTIKENIILWERFLGEKNLRYDIITDEEIKNGNYLNYTLMVVPGSLFLTADEANNLRRYIKSGGSIFASGIAEIHPGSSTGSSFYSELFKMDIFDAGRTDSLNTNTSALISVFRGEIPLTSGIPAGYKMVLSVNNFYKSIIRPGEKTYQISFCGRIQNIKNSMSTSVYGMNEKGRFIWTGFELSSVTKNEDKIILENFLFNSVKWLLHEPSVCTKYNRVPYEAAAVIAPVLSDSAANVFNILRILSNENLKASFFINPEKSILNLPLFSNLYKYGETAVYFENPGNYPLDVSNLKKSQRILEQVTGQKSAGCTFFPEINYEKTAAAAGKAGFTYILSDLAQIYSTERNKEYNLTVFGSASYKYIHADSATAMKFIAVNQEIDSIYYIHGLYVYKFAVDADQKNPQLVEKVIGHLKNKNFWITTFSEFQDNFRKIEKVKIFTERRGQRRIFLNITNSGETAVNEAAVDIDLNETSSVTSIYINPELIIPKKVKVLEINPLGILSLVFQELEPGESRSYFIDYAAESI